MDPALRAILILGTLGYVAIIVQLLRRKRLNIQYTLVWLISAVAMLVIAVFPDMAAYLAGLVGIAVPANFVFVVEGLFVLMILLSLSVIVSQTTNRIYRLTQKQAVLEKRVRDLEREISRKEEEDAS